MIEQRFVTELYIQGLAENGKKLPYDCLMNMTFFVGESWNILDVQVKNISGHFLTIGW